VGAGRFPWLAAKRVKVEPKEINVRPMSRKWGSCSTAGRVTYDAGLLAESADFRKKVNFRKKVIVRELLHLKVPNHCLLVVMATQLVITVIIKLMSSGSTA
jgi:Protein of unknown function DUF45